MPIFAGAVKLNGALFADAGNIWLSNPDPSFEGGEFAFNKLGQDIAMDVGIGTRFEIASFLTVRLDLAMPVKQPNVFVNNGWVFNQIDFTSSSWRSRNLVLNFSIGYPF
jgi:outer membrane protein assembly factor BamA